MVRSLSQLKQMNRPWMFGTNWKMNKTSHEASLYAETFRERLCQISDINSAQVFVIPPYTAIAVVKELSGGSYWVGAQNMHWEKSGPYTGEISAEMLVDIGVDIVQVGHAERRKLFHETDEMVNLKVHAALLARLRVLVCIGEDPAGREAHAAREICSRQLRVALAGVPVSAANQVILAYEPTWAIGENGVTADPDYIRGMKKLFRSILKEVFDERSADMIPILYGGSVNIDDAAALLVRSQVDGLFVGRAALDPIAFATLIESCLTGAKNPQLLNGVV
jgi:triosephosphate isomerase